MTDDPEIDAPEIDGPAIDGPEIDGPAIDGAVLDAHVHVWELSRRALAWLPSGHPLRRDFTLEGFTTDVVLVQADADPAEVWDLLALGQQDQRVVGVVGWFDLLDVPDRWPDDQLLVGVRSPPHDQTDPESMTAPAHLRGVRAAAEAGLAIDLLLRPSALIGAARLANAVPGARLVLDHLGNPDPSSAAANDDWLTGMRALAECPNVSVKLSGTAHLATDALRALVDVALELFGSQRLLFGSDWPVCTPARSRAEVLRRTTALLPPATHNDVLRGTAQRIYRPRETAPCPNTPDARSSGPQAPQPAPQRSPAP
ncbi:amidohydrolase family protein [Kribbella sp. NPDC048915]|uniref:amidohydrolase family protein n=1 Tax=Kribbella sp. NPDC048915 TaxID=3155148 RepID=UPI0033EF504D